MKIYIRIDKGNGIVEELRWNVEEGKYYMASSTLSILKTLHKAGKLIENKKGVKHE
jgi:hypothetical protein